MAAQASTISFEPTVCVVGFHHARGPEIETWFGVEDGTDPSVDNDWQYLPFMALSDGAHASTEDFSYFTLRRRASKSSPPSHPTSAFGISCTRQLDARELVNKPADVTRSTVQKAVVCITESPKCFGQMREKLSMITEAWFAQRDFTDTDILKVEKKFQESLSRSFNDTEDDQDLGLSLRALIHEYKHQTLVLFKCCLLQPKMLFFGSRCEQLCMVQFALITLIPGLLRHLEDCADPDFDSYEKNLIPPTSLKTSDRNSLLAYMGLPLQLFGKGGMFGPYTPLQQLDVLADKGTKSYIVGSTNALLLQQKDRYSDILINLDESSINITSPSLRAALVLSAADRRWIDFLTQTIQDTWDEQNPGRPKAMGYMGSEEFIRLQFEEYLLALLSTVKYHVYLSNPNSTPMSSIEGDPISDFNLDWFQFWQSNSASYALFARTTDSHLFDIVEPRHPTAGNLSFDDIQRRLNLQIQALNLDERLATSKETFNKHFAVGQKKVSTAFATLWADVEAMREAQRKRAEDAKHGLSPQPQKQASRSASPAPSNSDSQSPASRFAARAPDLTAAQASLQEAGKKAGAYMSTWGSWAAERRKAWATPRTSVDATVDEGGSGVGADTNTTPGWEPDRKAARLGSSGSIKSNGKGPKEAKGEDGIGRLDA